MIPRVVAVPGSVPTIPPKKKQAPPAFSVLGSGSPGPGQPYNVPSNVPRTGPGGRLPGPAPGTRTYQTGGGWKFGSRLLTVLGYVPLSQLTPLTAEAATLQAQVNSASAEATSLQSQLASLQSQVSAANANNASLQSQLASLNSQISAANASLSSLQSQLAGLASTLSADVASITTLKTQLASFQNQLSSLTATLNSYKSAIASLNSELGGLQNTLANDDAAIVSLQNQLASLNSTLSGLQSTLASDKTSLSSWQSQLAPLETTFNNLEGDIANLQQTLANDVASIKSLTGQLQSLQTQEQSYNILNGNYASYDGGGNNATSDMAGEAFDPGAPYDTGQQGFAPYNTLFQTNLASLAAGTSAHAVRYAAVPPVPSGGVLSTLARTLGYVPASQVKTEQGQIAALTATLDGYNTQIGTLQAQVSAQQSALATAQSQSASLTSGIQAASVSLSSVKAQVANVQGQISTVQANISTVNATISQLQSQISSTQAQVSSTNAEIASASTTISGLQAQISSTQAQITSAGSTISGLNGQISTATGQINTLNGPASNSGSIAYVVAEISSVKSQISVLNGSASQNGSIANAQATVSSLTNQHNGNLSTISNLQGGIATWKGYIANILSGNMPLSIQWDFGDGTRWGPSLSGGMSVNHTYSSPGTYTPTVTLGVERPDGVWFWKTFSLGGRIIGQWPTQGSYAVGGQTLSVEILDSNGAGVAGLRVVIVGYDSFGDVTNWGLMAKTDSSGMTKGSYAGISWAGTANVYGRVLRNPKVRPGGGA